MPAIGESQTGIGGIVNTIGGDTGPAPDDDRDPDIYRVRTTSGDTVDVRLRDIRPSLVE